jgi:hypothetical protein
VATSLHHARICRDPRGHADERVVGFGWPSVVYASLIGIEHSWRCQTAVSYQLVIDCTSPEPLAHFWAEALHYVIAPPPPGFDSWDDFFRSIGVSEDELGKGADNIEDPNGEGPRIWFQIVPEKKSIKEPHPHRRERERWPGFVARHQARAGRG